MVQTPRRQQMTVEIAIFDGAWGFVADAGVCGGVGVDGGGVVWVVGGVGRSGWVCDRAFC
ncbi:MAG: hypothetical protein HC860_05150 [Alkalinema sp. RU_4_3]|nr:hypothetical protein [Alkalinema sp. RU_4_3]